MDEKVLLLKICRSNQKKTYLAGKYCLKSEKKVEVYFSQGSYGDTRCMSVGLTIWRWLQGKAETSISVKCRKHTNAAAIFNQKQ